MSYDPNQGQQSGGTDPYSGYGNPQNPYGTPPPENPYGTPPPENPYAPQNPYEAPGYSGTNYGGANYQNAVPGQPGYGYGYPPPPQQPEATPLPLGQAIQQLPNQYIKVLTHPSAQTFAEEMGKADWGIVWVQLIGYAVIGAILSFLASLISPTRLNTTTTTGINPAEYAAILSGISFFDIILIPIVFFIVMGIFYLLAKAFGGQGSFLQQCYTSLLFGVPLGILVGLFNLIPFAGGVIAFAIGIYEIVLQIFAFMAVHRLSGGKATAAVLIPIAVLFVLLCGLVILIVAIIASATRNGG